MAFFAFRSKLVTCFLFLRRLTFQKDFARKAMDAHLGVAPCFTRQYRFPAGFLEKLLTSPMMFDGHLQQQQASLRVEPHQQSMTPDLN